MYTYRSRRFSLLILLLTYRMVTMDSARSRMYTLLLYRMIVTYHSVVAYPFTSLRAQESMLESALLLGEWMVKTHSAALRSRMTETVSLMLLVILASFKTPTLTASVDMMVMDEMGINIVRTRTGAGTGPKSMLRW